MLSFNGLKDNKIALLVNIIITIGIFMNERMSTGLDYSTAFFGSLGYLTVWIIIWFVAGGYVLLNIFHAVHNLFKPENDFKFSLIDRFNFGILVGWIVRLFW